MENKESYRQQQENELEVIQVKYSMQFTKIFQKHFVTAKKVTNVLCFRKISMNIFSVFAVNLWE